jgi:hypothetical protein
MNKQTWLVSLKYFQQPGQCLSNSLPDRQSLSEEEEWQCRIIGGEFISWYKHDLSYILQQRIALQVRQFDKEPILVFTTSIPGLVATREIIKEPSENLVCLLHHKFEKWIGRNPVDEFIFHIHHWSYFKPIDEDLLELAQTSYPKIDPAEFRIHTSGDLWGERCGLGADHLWRWNGSIMELIEESCSQIRF